MATFNYGGVINIPVIKAGFNNKAFAYGGSDYNGSNPAAMLSKKFVKTNLVSNITTQYNWFQVKPQYLSLTTGRGFPTTGTSSTTVIGSVTYNVYRGRIGGNYVYNVGTPPLGATDIVVIGTVVS